MVENKKLLAMGMIIGIALIIFAKGEFIFTVSFPDDYIVERLGYDLPRSFDLQESGIIELPDGTDIVKVYKIIFSIKGCGTKSEIILDGKSVGSISTSDCESLFYSDQGNEEDYQHYSTGELQVFTKVPGALSGFELKSRRISYAFLDTSKDTSFSTGGKPQIVSKPIIKREATAIETVDCTRNSQCPGKIIGQGQLFESACNQIVHKCSAGSAYWVQPPPPQKEVEIPWFGIVIFGIIIVLGILVLLFSNKIFRNK